NRDWGKVYFLSFDQLTLLNFENYVSASNLTPQWRFTPMEGNRYNISDGVFNSMRWSSQLGIRLNF
ncbi:MAG TPA: hypothetical protein VEB42_05560, partial [Chitinophagaceae bacterium]|nr:hypothetical protein [Chitinophagaceae bacterium]